MLTPWKESYGKLRQCIQKQSHHFADKGPPSQSYRFSSSHVWMWELDYKEIWVPKNWCFWTVVLEKTLESPLDCKEIQPVHPKGDQSWMFIGRTDVEAETPILRSPDVKSWLHLKRSWCWERLKVGEGEDRGWDGWMASCTQLMWVLVNSASWWWTERPGVLQSMGSQRVGHDWATELNRTDSIYLTFQVVLVLKNLPHVSQETWDASSILGLERSPGGGHVAWQATVHRIAKIWIQLKQLSRHTHITYIKRIILAAQ